MPISQPNLPTIVDVEAAASRIKPHAVLTPAITNPILDERIGGRAIVKCEVLQRTGSFKFRGAYNAIASLDPATRARGVVTCSSGNHAQGVAEAARLFGVPATIVMPSDAPAVKQQRTERSGARIVAYDRRTEDRDAIAAAIVERDGVTLIHPFNDRDVIAGQGTAGLELMRQAADSVLLPDIVVVPCGGGGLSSGVGIAVKAVAPAAEIWAVEPEDSDDYRRSLAAGRIIANETVSGSVGDSLLAKAPGAIGFALNQRQLAGVVTVDDRAMLDAVAFAYHELKLVVEPGGAAAMAAVLSGKIVTKGRTVAIILSGGNIDPTMMARALAP